MGYTDIATDGVIYLDYHATTPCDERVVEAMLPFFTECFANPSSPHRSGRVAERAVKKARGTVAEHIGAFPGEVIFTSGATESNNLAITGLAQAYAGKSPRHRILTSAIEHKSVLKPAAGLERIGFQHDTIPVNSGGRVDLSALQSMIDEDTLLVSVQAANNEVGTIQPVAEVAEITHSHGALFHCDGVQALGRLGISVKKWRVDFLSLSAHKAYGPKGVGALYVRGGTRGLNVRPRSLGGGQEDGVRSGTLNVPGIVGFAKACSLIDEVFENEVARLAQLRDELQGRIEQTIDNVVINGDQNKRLASTTNIHFPGTEAEALLARTSGLAISTGSACNAGALEPSYVLTAMGLSRRAAYESLRFSVGRYTTYADVCSAAEEIAYAVANVRATS